MATLNPPLGGRGVLTVADDQVDRYIEQGWTRADGDGPALAVPEETQVSTDTGGGPEAGGDIEFTRTLVSDELGDTEVLGTNFGHPGEIEPLDLGDNPKADVEPDPAVTVPQSPAEPEGEAGAGVAEVSGDEPVKPKTTRSRAK